MITHFESIFLNDIQNLKNTQVKRRIQKFIDQIIEAQTAHQIAGIKKLKGHPTAYRCRIGDYRVGLFIEKNEVILSRCLHRKDIYRQFPK